MLYNYAATLVRIIDGDTVSLDVDAGFGIWLRGERFRLAGINAPEMNTPEGQVSRSALLGSIVNAKLEIETKKAELTNNQRRSPSSLKLSRNKIRRLRAYAPILNGIPKLPDNIMSATEGRCLIIGLVFGLIVGELTAWYFTDDAWAKDAVAQGHGTWTTYCDDDGQTWQGFVWVSRNRK